MGWTTMPRHGQTVQDILRCAMRGPYHEVLDIAIVNRNTAYIAARLSPPGKDSFVCAYVFLLRYWPKAADGYDFGYKDMDETMGPVECDCPERILKLLTPTTSVYAAEWRKQCWARLELKKKLRPGAQFSLAEPIRFSDGTRRQNFEVVSRGRYRSLETGTVCRISPHVMSRVTITKEVPNGKKRST